MHRYTSMKEGSGRMAVILPHGVLFRPCAKAKIRKKLLDLGTIEAVIGLGPNLFYNSPMESCAVILRMNKPKERKNKVLFISGVKEPLIKSGASRLW